jgi:hypothetical protein
LSAVPYQPFAANLFSEKSVKKVWPQGFTALVSKTKSLSWRYNRGLEAATRHFAHHQPPFLKVFMNELLSKFIPIIFAIFIP